MNVQECLSGLKKQERVYILDSQLFSDPVWRVYQEREKAFWTYETERLTYNPDPVGHVKPSLKHWRIDTEFFKGKTVLEIGSGPFGFFSGVEQINEKHLPENLVVSDSLMDFYQKLNVFKLIPGKAIPLKSPGEDLPFPNRSFDIIVTNNTIDHVKDCTGLLKECKRLLKDDGYLLFSTHIIVDFMKVFKPVLKKIDTNHPHHFTEEEVDDLFKGNGFELLSKVCIPLYKEESVPQEANIIKKCLFLTGFRLMRTFYGIAKKTVRQTV